MDADAKAKPHILLFFIHSYNKLLPYVMPNLFIFKVCPTLKYKSTSLNLSLNLNSPMLKVTLIDKIIHFLHMRFEYGNQIRSFKREGANWNRYGAGVYVGELNIGIVFVCVAVSIYVNKYPFLSVMMTMPSSSSYQLQSYVYIISSFLFMHT